MKTTTANTFILTLICVSVYAQNSALPSIIRTQNTMDVLSRGGVGTNQVNYGIPIQMGGLIGDAYLNKTWNKSSILMYDVEKLAEGYPTRINLQEANLEIKASNGIRVLSLEKVKSLVWIDSITQHTHYFVNAREFSVQNNELSGLLEVLVDGNVALMKHTTAYIKKADYNVALNVGSREDKIIRKTKYYFLKDNQFNSIKSKKSLLQKFPAMEAWLSENSFDLDNQRDLVSIFEKINQANP